MDEPAQRSEPSPYKRFESFLKRLVAVPKAEIDQKAAEQKRQPRPAYPGNQKRG
jgi:hypothetical protein